MSRRRILIATTNAGKLREIREVMGHLDVEWLALDQLGPVPEAIEDSATFEENAAKKALHYALCAGLWTLADDSGLEVDALGGRPGVHSARFAGSRQDDVANNAKLVRELRGVPPVERTARFRCELALADGKDILATASGAVEGLIIDDSRGKNGFGYDSHFLLPKLGLTTAELSPEQKNRISHRGRALRSLRPEIKELLE